MFAVLTELSWVKGCTVRVYLREAILPHEWMAAGGGRHGYGYGFGSEHWRHELREDRHLSIRRPGSLVCLCLCLCL